MATLPLIDQVASTLGAPGPPRKGFLRPFVNISLTRGKSGEYLEAVSRAVHDALVAELHMKPEDDFQLIRQHERQARNRRQAIRTRLRPRVRRSSPRAPDIVNW